MRKTISLPLLLLALPLIGWGSSFELSAQSVERKPPSFYSERERGWFWHEPDDPEPEKEDEAEPPATPLPETTPRKQESAVIPLDAQWLEENIPVLMRAAINNPTRENIAAYAYAQRLMMDMSSRFSTRMMEFMALEDSLSEEARRPTSAFSLQSFKDETAQNLRGAINKVGSQSHLWFFFSSTCGYCQRQIPILRELVRRYDVEVLAVSLDGYSMPGLEDFEHVYDDDMSVAMRLGVEFTPTTFLVSNDGEYFANIGAGLSTLPELESRFLIASKDSGFITDDEYMLATSVRDVNVVSREDGVIMAERELIESDPGYLADMLRTRLQSFQRFGRTKIGD